MRYRYLLIIFSCLVAPSYGNWFSSQKKAARTIIMLNPHGDAAHAGRSIEDSFERGITLQIAEYLKLRLEEHYPHVTVLLTRMPGEIIEPLHNAQCANRISPFMYISIHCYEEKNPLPHVYLYTFSYGNSFFNPSKELSLYRYDQAHLLSKQKSAEISNIFANALKREEYNRCCIVEDVIALPFKPLLGITCPAFAVEIGLAQKKDWHMIAAPFLEGIQTVLNTSIVIN
ncbi:hypothetical protein Noda2021_01200 [Candidatus Dependentiae bacterium Noda2021]|nr:hypothetical protein Noda2021_01200 [Candidatus Dependentiae bacterium Noda2021]